MIIAIVLTKPQSGYLVMSKQRKWITNIRLTKGEDRQMENSYRYFENRACQYYPCHDMEHMNCLFCYCPLNHMEKCPGTPLYIEVNGKRIKDCSSCPFPHEPENYDVIMKILSQK